MKMKIFGDIIHKNMIKDSLDEDKIKLFEIGKEAS